MVPLPSMDVNHGSSPSTTLLNNHYFEEPRQPNSHSQLITSHSTSSRKSNTLRLPHCIIILFPLYFKNSPLYWLFLLIKRLKQFPVLDWWGAGGAVAHLQKTILYHGFLGISWKKTHVCSLPPYEHTHWFLDPLPTHQQQFIHSVKIILLPFFTLGHHTPFTCFSYACLLSLCDLLLQEHALIWCSIRPSKYSNNVQIYPKVQSLIFSLLYNSFLNPPLGCTSEPKTQQVCYISSRHTLHLIWSCRCSGWHVISTD